MLQLIQLGLITQRWVRDVCVTHGYMRIRECYVCHVLHVSAQSLAMGISTHTNYYAELRQKYDELVQYCLSVEKLKGQIIKENEQLRQRLNIGPTDSLGTKLSFELWYIPIIIMVMAIAAKYMGHI